VRERSRSAPEGRDYHEQVRQSRETRGADRGSARGRRGRAHDGAPPGPDSFVARVSRELDELRETLPLYGVQLARLAELHEAAWRNELEIQELARLGAEAAASLRRRSAPTAPSAPNGTQGGEGDAAAVERIELPPIVQPDGIAPPRATASYAEVARELLQLARRRPQAKPYEALKEEVQELQRQARRAELLAAKLDVLGPIAADHDRLREEVQELQRQARRAKLLAAKRDELRPQAAEYERLRGEVQELQRQARRAELLAAKRDALRAQGRPAGTE